MANGRNKKLKRHQQLNASTTPLEMNILPAHFSTFFYTLSLFLLALKKYVQLYKKNCSKMMLIHVLVSISKMLMMILLRTFYMKKKL